MAMAVADARCAYHSNDARLDKWFDICQAYAYGAVVTLPRMQRVRVLCCCCSSAHSPRMLPQPLHRPLSAPFGLIKV